MDAANHPVPAFVKAVRFPAARQQHGKWTMPVSVIDIRSDKRISGVGVD
jgi:hypothetical protein